MILFTKSLAIHKFKYHTKFGVPSMLLSTRIPYLLNPIYIIDILKCSDFEHFKQPVPRPIPCPLLFTFLTSLSTNFSSFRRNTLLKILAIRAFPTLVVKRSSALGLRLGGGGTFYEPLYNRLVRKGLKKFVCVHL